MRPTGSGRRGGARRGGGVAAVLVVGLVVAALGGAGARAVEPAPGRPAVPATSVGPPAVPQVAWDPLVPGRDRGVAASSAAVAAAPSAGAASVRTVGHPRALPTPVQRPTPPPPPPPFTRPTPPPPPGPPPEPRQIRIAATGDLLIHSPVWRAADAHAPGEAFDFVPLLRGVGPIVEPADLGICHLEVPLTRDRSRLSSYPIFNAPADLARAVAAIGWDVCSTASNHSADQGFPGLVETLDVLDEAGVAHRGTARTPEEDATPVLLPAGPATVGLVAATYGLNGLPVPGGHPWSVDLIDVPAILADARAARAAGADLVVAALHWGEEYRHAPTAFQQDVAAAVMADGAVDAIIGHHAHVVQPIALVAGRPVVYGLGNLLSGQTQREVTRDGVVVVLTATEDPATGRWAFTSIDWGATQVARGSYEVLPADDASRARTNAVLGELLGPAPIVIPTAAPAPAG